MYRRIAIVIAFLCSSLLAQAQLSALDSIVTDEMQKQHITGLSLGIIRDGKVIVRKGYGYASLKDSIPASERTVFKIGSLSKHIIATCIVALSEQGKLNLSDHVNKYFKDAPAEWSPITIRNLLQHTSGIERESPLFDWMKRQPDSLLIVAVYKDKLHFTPGSKWEYSNMGYFMLADIIHKVTGQSFEDYMNHFFLQQGLQHTTTTTISKGADKAIGYNYNKAIGQIFTAIDFTALRPSGAFSSSMTDMIKWDSIQQESTLLTKQGWAKTYEDTVRQKVSINGSVAYYGYGWFVNQYHGHRLVHHGGNTRGFTTEYWRFIDDKLSIIILANADEVPLPKMAAEIAATLNPDFKQRKQIIANIDKYPGVYDSKELGMKITISKVGNGLVAQATGQSSFPLEYIGAGKFSFDEAGIEIDFEPDKNELVLKQYGGADIFMKEK